MISIPHKAKQFTVFIVKLLIVIAAFYFIYQQLAKNPKLEWARFQEEIIAKTSWLTIIVVLLFSVVNRYLEILKWQNLVTVIEKINLYEASQQVLGALTAGIFTPNGLGEYAGKALYFSKKQTKKIIFLNLICNGVQMIYTTLFGVLGMFLLGYKWYAVSIFGILVLGIGISFLVKSIKIKGYSFEKLVHKINEIPRQVHQKNMFLAFCRYLVFSHQYYVLFLIFGVDLPYVALMACITAVYFLSSALPSFQFLDFAVKGGVAVFFLGKLGVNEWVVIFVSTLMWLLNVVLPVILGSYFVIKFKPQWSSLSPS